MSAAISGAARWMSLIWEIRERALTPGPGYGEPRSHQTDEPGPAPPITARILYTPGAHAHLHTAG